MGTARNAPRLSPRVSSSTTKRVRSSTHAHTTSIKPPLLYAIATPLLSPRSTLNSLQLSTATPTPHQPPQHTLITLKRALYIPQHTQLRTDPLKTPEKAPQPGQLNKQTPQAFPPSK